MRKRSIIALSLCLCVAVSAGCSARSEKGSGYTVRFSSGDAIIAETEKQGGETLEKPKDPSKAHYTFGGWFNGDEEWNFEKDEVLSDITLVAKWSPEVYSVTFITEVGETPERQTVIYDPVNGKIEKPDIKEVVVTSTREYKFERWYSGDMAWNFDSRIVENNIELKARWRVVEEFTEESFLPSV